MSQKPCTRALGARQPRNLLPVRAGPPAQKTELARVRCEIRASRESWLFTRLFGFQRLEGGGRGLRVEGQGGEQLQR